MFRHRGKSRTTAHNLSLAAMLSFVAGTVNITGVLAVSTLTTNVTGHFAFFAEEVMRRDYFAAFVFLIYICSFLLGAFTASFFAELVMLHHPRRSHLIPMLIEISVLFACGFGLLTPDHPVAFACILLFAMGNQNSMVTRVSSSVVRTTHLTGLFTDLGIELSQLFFYRQPDEKRLLTASLQLRSIIISCFFAGCLCGGFIFLLTGTTTLVFSGIILLCTLLYDNVRHQMHFFRRKNKSGLSQKK